MAEGHSPSEDHFNKYCDDSPFSSRDNINTLERPCPEIASVESRALPCKFFLQGRCAFQDKCWNNHIIPSKDNVNPRHVERNNAICKPSTSGEVSENATAELSIENQQSVSSGSPKRSPALQASSTRKLKNESRFCSLTKKGVDPKTKNPPNWIDAPEFVPRASRSYADTVRGNCVQAPKSDPVMELCVYFVDGECPFDPGCPYIHGEPCDICQKNCMHPFDENQRKAHTELCEKELEQDMELSFAVQRSKDKSCGICMDVIMEKEPMAERRFGILEKCNHIFCLACIRKWRQVKSSDTALDSELDRMVTRTCPECRVASDFITPSQFWVDTEEEKGKLIADYKVAMSQKACKYFKQGKGTCPFGGACFYLHAKPDGTKVTLPPPVRRRRQNQDGALDFNDPIILWDFLEFRDENLLIQLEMDDLVHSFTESSNSSDDGSDC